MSAGSTSTTTRRPAMVSVILPFRDAAEYLPSQLAALANQAYDGPWELVACDDGSVDDSRSLVEEAGKTHKWSVTIVTGEGRGPGPARNAAARIATGDLLCFCDADDVVDTAWLTALSEAASTSDFVAGRLDRSELNPSSIRQSRGDAHDRAQVLASSCNLAVWADRFAELGGFDAAFRVGEDTDLSMRALQHGLRISFAADAVVAYRYRTGLRSIFRQQLRSGMFGRLLRRRYANATGLLPARRSIVRQWGWLALRAPYLVTKRRALWVAQLGMACGDLCGRFRQLPPVPKPTEPA